jgi:hypothetical protein
MNRILKFITRWSFNRRLKKINRMSGDELSSYARNTVGSLVELAKNDPDEYDRRMKRRSELFDALAKESRNE